MSSIFLIGKIEFTVVDFIFPTRKVLEAIFDYIFQQDNITSFALYHSFE